MKSRLGYVMTIPSIDIKGCIEIRDLALIGSEDKSYQEIKKANPFLSKYLDSFRTPFGRKISPSIIIRDKILPKVDADRLVSFRNAIAISAVIYSRARSCLCGNAVGYTCTDLFDFHPVSVSSDGTDLSVRTAYTLGVDNRIDEFRGQTTLSEVYPGNIRTMLDEEFMILLLNLIEKKAVKREEKEFRNRIIRCLEMAYYALRAPFILLGNKTDFGAPLSLWVSAFETVGYHYKKGKNVGFSDVSALIKKVPWQSYKLRQRKRTRITEDFGRRRAGQKTSIPVQVYGRLYSTRNMYLHGVPVPKGQFEFRRRKKWGNLFFQVPALFRCVLMHVLRTEGILVDSKYPSNQRQYESVLLKGGV